MISESVSAYLDRLSFSNVADISQLLSRLTIRSDALAQYYASLAALIERRHQIVHRADLAETPSDGERDPQTINASQVREWRRAVQLFISGLVACCITRNFGATLAQRARQRSVGPALSDPDSTETQRESVTPVADDILEERG